MITKIFLIILLIVLIANKPTYAFLKNPETDKISGIKFPLWKTPFLFHYYGRGNIILTSRAFFDEVWKEILEER